MTVSYGDETRRDDLRAAALFVVDDERQRCGYDKRVRGSLGLPDVGRIFEETLAVFPLESEVGGAIRTAGEIPCWRGVLEKLEPLWKMFPATAQPGPRLIESEEWRALRGAVARCVDRHGLWQEEIEYPATVLVRSLPTRIEAWSDFEQLDPSLITRASDARGRPIEFEPRGSVAIRRVGLPPPRET